ncbi:chloride intracellular channel protein 3 [Sigmodon hispidus]
MAETKLQLFVKASEDGESVGNCPSCQRLFMVLLLKGVPFTLTTVDTRRALDVLKDFAPGSQLPILLYDGDVKTDTLQIEEFLEATLRPPDFPSLAPQYRESNIAGNDIFHKFSAFIKNPVPTQDNALYQQLLRALTKLDSYLRTPLDHELVQEPKLCESRRRFLDGDQFTLADCSLLPKLHIVDTPNPMAYMLLRTSVARLSVCYIFIYLIVLPRNKEQSPMPRVRTSGRNSSCYPRRRSDLLEMDCCGRCCPERPQSETGLIVSRPCWLSFHKQLKNERFMSLRLPICFTRASPLMRYTPRSASTPKDLPSTSVAVLGPFEQWEVELTMSYIADLTMKECGDSEAGGSGLGGDIELRSLGPEGKAPKRVFPMTVTALEGGDLEVKITFWKKNQCHEKKFVLHKTDEPGKYSAFKGKKVIRIQELSVKDHYIFYCEGRHHGKSHRKGKLVGRTPDANPEAMEEFKEFVKSKRFPLENIFLPEQSDQCIPESD